MKNNYIKLFIFFIIVFFSSVFFINKVKADDIVFFNQYNYPKQTCCYGSSFWTVQQFKITDTSIVNNISKIQIYSTNANTQPQIWDMTLNQLLWTGTSKSTGLQIWDIDPIIEIEENHEYKLTWLAGNNPSVNQSGTPASSYSTYTNVPYPNPPVLIYYDDKYGLPIIMVWHWPDLLSATSTFEFNKQKVFPIYFDACDSYNDFNSASIQPVYLSGEYSPAKRIIQPKDEFIGPQKCKGNYTYYDIYNDDLSGYVDFIFTTYDVDYNVISTTTSNRIVFETILPDEEGYITSMDPSPYMIDLGLLPYWGHTSTSTLLNYYYDFSDRNIASTTLYLINYRDGTTVASSTGPFTAKGANTITITTPTTPTANLYRYRIVSEGDDDIYSNLFNVSWFYKYTSEDDVIDEINIKCQEETPIFSDTGICDGIDTSTWFGGLNCGTREAFTYIFRIFFKPSCPTITKFGNSFTELKQVFPFNVYFDLTDTINTAIDTSLTSTSTTGTIDVPFIRQTSTSSEFYALPMASSSTLQTLIGVNNYNTYRTTLGFIWWIIVSLIIYITIRKI